MSAETNHGIDPSFAIAMEDTADTDLSPEAMEKAHEAMEEERAALLGLVPVGQIVELSSKQEVDKSQEAQEQEELAAHYNTLIANADHRADINIIFDSIKLDVKAGLISQEQFAALEARRAARELYLKHLASPSAEDDGRYGKQY